MAEKGSEEVSGGPMESHSKSMGLVRGRYKSAWWSGEQVERRGNLAITSRLWLA